MMLPYSAVDVVALMSASFAEAPVRRPRSLRNRLIALIALAELTALWVGVGALTSLT